jgi:hypothetical protein
MKKPRPTAWVGEGALPRSPERALLAPPYLALSGLGGGWATPAAQAVGLGYYIAPLRGSPDSP